MTAQLERAYRRLLRAYPRRYRRDEVLTTLLDAARPGQRRPDPREAAHLLLSGIRCRFTPPRGQSSWVVVMALIGAIAGGALAGWAMWVPPPPDAEVRAVAAVVLPDPTYSERIDHPEMLTAGEPVPAGAAPAYVAFGANRGATVAETRARLAGAGWRLGPVRGNWYPAVRGDLLVVVRMWPDNTVVQVHRRQPAAVWPVCALATLAGAVLAWLLTVWGLHRWVASGRRRRVVGVYGTLGVTLLGSAAFLAVLPVTNTRSPYVLYGGAHLIMHLQPLLPVLGLVAIGVALVLLARRPVPSPSPEPSAAVDGQPDSLPGLARGLAFTHLAFAVAAAAVLTAYAIRPADPKDLIPFGDSFLNPLMYVYALVALAFPLGIVASPVLLLVSGPLLVFGRRRVGPSRWRLLLASAPTALVLGVLPFTGVLNWWLD